MKFEIYEYKPNEDGHLEKVILETLEYIDPSETGAPYRYLENYILKKRIALEEVNNKIIDEWYSKYTTYLHLNSKIEKIINSLGEFTGYGENYWKLNNPIVNKMADVLSQVYLMTFGNTEAFLKTNIMETAPEEFRNLYIGKTRDDYYPWLQYMTNPEANRPVRPIIPEDKYSKFEKPEAKEIIVAIRDKFIRNNEDSMADSLKLCSFLAGAIRRIYNVLPKESIDRLSAVDKNILDYGFGLQSTLQTRCDSELAEEGLPVIDKLLTREDSINEIILLVYSHLKV